MKFVNVRELRATSAKILSNLAKEKEIVITSNGKPVAILSPVQGDNLEESLAAIRRARAMAAVEAMQTASVKSGRDRMSLEEIDQEITQERRERPK